MEASVQIFFALSAWILVNFDIIKAISYFVKDAYK